MPDGRLNSQLRSRKAIRIRRNPRKMDHRWQYLRLSGEPDLDQLGSEGWELVAIRGEEWLLKRPALDPTERFTLEQRTSALSSTGARQVPAFVRFTMWIMR